MFKNLSRTFNLLKPKSLNLRPQQRTFLTTKFQNTLNKSLPLTSLLPHITIPRSRFCTVREPQDFQCQKVNDLHEELTETLNNNIKRITTSLVNKGINSSSFFLHRLSYMQYTKEPKIFNVLYDNIHREIHTVYDQNCLLSILEGK